MLKTEAIQKFLSQQPFYMCKYYTPEMEVQVNVLRGEGEPIQGTYAGLRWQGFTNGLQIWKPFRIPWNAGENPQYIDKDIKFDISQHIEAIGMTGWNWTTLKSQWVGFDFDSLLAHKEGLSSEELIHIQKQLEVIPFITLLTSTGGAGLHVYVFTKFNLNIQTHTEHAAIARAILDKISALTGLTLQAKVDSLGGNMWVWHRKAILGKGYELLKKGKTLTDIPLNWQDYLSIVSKKRKIKTIKAQSVDDIIASKNVIKLEEDHLKLLKWFDNSTALWWWNSEKQMLVCHTADLKRAHVDLNFKGFFETISTGKDHGQDQNCFAFPFTIGAWIIRRHTKGITEAPTWFLDTSGWTTCYFNRLPSIRTASKQMGGIEGEKEYYFKTLASAIRVLLAIGIDFNIDVYYHNRPTYLQHLKDKKIKLSFERTGGEILEGWVPKKDRLEKFFFLPKVIDEIELPDNLIRHVTIEDMELGWYTLTNNKWIAEGRYNLVSVLLSVGYKRSEIDNLLGRAILHNWRLVNKPFQPEYPGNREWNKNAPQFSCIPERGKHKHWDLILSHCGESLNEILLQEDWAKDNGIINGLLYLQSWIASFIQTPTNPTPYLFFTGPQNSGKSILHEALELLFTSGYCRADQALTNPSGFNGELFNAIVCVVEETNLSKRGYASDRIKDWVTGQTVSIHTKGKTPYNILNSTHWIQCANTPEYCPIFPGDTRITMCQVNNLKTEIPKGQLLKKLEEEAPAFLYTVLHFDLPESKTRLAIPVIETMEKIAEMEYNKTALDRFIDEKIFKVNGHMVLFSDFYDEFQRWLDPIERIEWTKHKVTRLLPFIKGRASGEGRLYIGNISFKSVSDSRLPLKIQKGRLTMEGL